MADIKFHMENVGFCENAYSILADYGLDKYEYLDKGSTAIIFGDSERVFRLSSDPSSHCLIAFANQIGGLSVPTMYQDYGAIAILDDIEGEQYYWLGEFERMAPLDIDSQLYKNFVHWLSEVMTGVNDDQLIFSECQQDLIDTLKQYLSGHPFSNIARTLIQLTEWCNGEMDLDISNFMLRQSSGEIVVVDPSHGMSIDEKEWNRVFRTECLDVVGK